jgi:hypothetical protein
MTVASRFVSDVFCDDWFVQITGDYLSEFTAMGLPAKPLVRPFILSSCLWPLENLSDLAGVPVQVIPALKLKKLHWTQGLPLL